MPTKITYALLPLLLFICLLTGCSANPTELTLDDAAQALGDDARSQLRASQEEYRRKCKGALAFKSAPVIERPEPGGFADEEFRNLKWPDWVEDETPKALIFYSRAPELMQVRFTNRWLPLDGQLTLRSTLANGAKSLAVNHRPDVAALASAQALIDGCPQPEAQGWIARQFYDGLEEARDTINDYALPKRHWFTSWYYTLAFDPLLNGFLLLSGLFGFSSSVLVIFPLMLVLCLDKKGLEFLTKLGMLPLIGIIYVGSKVKPEWVGRHAASILSTSLFTLSLAGKGFRLLLGLPSYAVLCIALLGRPEDILTAQNHLYSWMPASTLSHIPVQGSLFGIVSPLVPAGWVAGLVYFLASCINQAENIYKAAQLYATDDELLEQRLGVLSEIVKAEREQSDEVVMSWLKQLWRTILFSFAIACAPLALSLYFVIKAVSDAAWVVASFLGEKLRVSIPAAIRALPHAAILIVLIAAYSKLPAGSAGAAPPRPPAPAAQTATVGVRAVAVRDKPTPKGRVVSRLKRGDQVQVMGNDSNGWAEVRLADGTAGYVPRSVFSAPPVTADQNGARPAKSKRRRKR